MNRIDELARALARGREQFRAIMEGESSPEFAPRESYDTTADRNPDDDTPAFRGRIGVGDNLDYMTWLLKEQDMAGKIQLIYIDPPFFSGSGYQASVYIRSEALGRSPVLKAGAYSDRWGSDLEEYLAMLAVRLCLMRELLSDTGCLWVHLDWHGSHYVKMMLDEIFGHDRFVNEVVWTYKSGGASKRTFARKHDTLLFYSKTKEYTFHPQKEKSYNREGKPYRFKGVEEFRDEGGWYTMVNMKDVWTIDMVGRTSAERMGYATQKPEKLVERIVRSCSDPGDLCADFFAGTGTLGAACSRLGRPWIMCDEGEIAIADQVYRMARRPGNFTLEHRTAAARPEGGAADGAGEAEVGADAGARSPDPSEIGAADVPIRRTLPAVEVAAEDGMARIWNYRPDLRLVREEDRETVFRYLSDDNLSLVRFWSCRQWEGPDGPRTEQSGGPSAGEARVHLGGRLLSGGEFYPLKEDGGSFVSIVGYDIFGGRFEWSGEIK